MRIKHVISLSILLLPSIAYPQVEDTIELKTTTIKANTELPKILYVVPWQDANNTETSQQKLVLHSLFGDLFEPVTPLSPAAKAKRNR